MKDCSTNACSTSSGPCNAGCGSGQIGTSSSLCSHAQSDRINSEAEPDRTCSEGFKPAMNATGAKKHVSLLEQYATTNLTPFGYRLWKAGMQNGNEQNSSIREHVNPMTAIRTGQEEVIALARCTQAQHLSNQACWRMYKRR